MANFILSEDVKKSETNVAVVLGGACVNSLHIVRAINKNAPIIAINDQCDPGLYSKYVTARIIDKHIWNESKFLKLMVSIGESLHKKGVLFPTSDTQVLYIAKNYDILKKYYFIPINKNTVISLLSKKSQYELCEKLKIPYPKTFFIGKEDDINILASVIKEFKYPIIIKPTTSNDEKNIFKVKKIENEEALHAVLSKVKQSKGEFLVSELIPGEPDNIWTYIGYADFSSNLIAGWTAKKLTQRPYYFGVFSTARYEKNTVVEKQGLALLHGGEYYGIFEPEFKFDNRDGQYKLIEINPRYMMFHGLGVKGGINLPLIQYYHCIGDDEKLKSIQKIQNDNVAHIVFMHHELMNLYDHHPKIKFLKNVILAIFRKNKIWGIYCSDDLVPFFIFIKSLFLRIFFNK